MTESVVATARAQAQHSEVELEIAAIQDHAISPVEDLRISED
jgi:hypothetical protein